MALIQLHAAADLIRFEKNLLQIGFFGAHDTRHSNQYTRRIEQWASRDGQRIRLAAEFRASQEHGLPSTSDRDKFIAFMKIAMEQRGKTGRIENPIRFSGYQMLKELGLTYSGENYEDINRWGQRLADTTITSEQVIYLAARKRYANKTVHVFRSFLRAGQSNMEETGRTESFEVVLEDWILENLNESYVVPEDFNAYRRLLRPTAKGIFGYLHMWFFASQGKPIEKDYSELCMLLNIPAYRYVSKIKETMGKSLDELVHIGYLSYWDVKPMVSKQGYKLVLGAGEQLVHVLTLTQTQSKQLEEGQPAEALTNAQRSAVDLLSRHGINGAKALALVREFPVENIYDLVEYAKHLMERDKRQKIDNPAGFIIYLIENKVTVPTGFVTTRHVQDARHDEAAETKRVQLEHQYHEFVEEQVDEAVKRAYPGEAWPRKIKETVQHKRKTDRQFEQLGPMAQESTAEVLIRAEIREELDLPGLADWVQTKGQLDLFRRR